MISHKNGLFCLFIFFLLTCCFVKADVIEEPKIITINGRIRMYEGAAKKIIDDAKARGWAVKRDKNSIEIPGNSTMFEEVVELYKVAMRQNTDVDIITWADSGCVKGANKNFISMVAIDKKNDLVVDILFCGK